ncbi:MAG TPA: DUF4215 domain-containing protein [Labilithrix sp.]|jgi:cysteine-rich repeat protein|nr:DUF4215 domain-containing protein [Labilithrix sp.]
MRVRGFWLSLTAVASILIATQACSENEGTDEDRICTPGAYVFCRCADRAAGTKLCKADGKSFEACTTGQDGQCIGGEVSDPRTNQPVPRENWPTSPHSNDRKKLDVDACPGKSTAVQPNIEFKLEGDTTGAVDDRSGRGGGACAVGRGANDHIYRLIPSGRGSLEVKVQGSDGLDPVAYIRTSCDQEESQASCGPPTRNNLAQLKYNVTTGKEYFLVIDGASGTMGKYTATLKLTPGSFCGDGVVDEGEACDDGNHVDYDGCSSNCRAINGNPPSAGSCPGQPVDVWPGQTVTGTGSTIPYGNSWNTPAGFECGFEASGTNSGPDHIYAVTPRATGSLVVRVTAPTSGWLADHMISVRRTCETMETEVGLCANWSMGPSAIDHSEDIIVPVTKNQKIFVAVDGDAAYDKGDYTISFQLQ